MKRVCLLFTWLFFQSCNNEEIKNNKDLEQNMMDLKIYQENLGEQLKAKNLSDASWFLEGMDSILLILNDRFKVHHKMTNSFSYFYRRRMKTPITGIRKAIQQNDTAKALQGYRILIKNCNNCHADHDIDKEVRF